MARPLLLRAALVASALAVGCDVPPSVEVDGASAGATDGASSPSEQDATTPSRDASPAPRDAGTDADAASDASDAAADGEADADADASTPPRCGVGEPLLCMPGEGCTVSDDCEGLCSGGICDPPSHADGKLSPSLGETAVDCGGPDALVDPIVRCENGLACSVGSDCRSGACDPVTGACVGATSCVSVPAASRAGIDTCGVGETGSAAAAHESCCASLPLPVTTTRRLDKYEITAGRVRRFVEALTATYGTANVRDFAKGFAAANPGSQLEILDTSHPGLFDVLPASSAPTAKLSLVTALGLFAIDPINTLDGCFVSNGASGHSTYFWDAATRGVFRLPRRVHAQETLDEKPINCTMPLLLMAFCAWDGGELARMTDYREVWGKNPQPLGSSSVYVPWATLLPIGDFAFRNGQHVASTCPAGWPGCVPGQPEFYRFPLQNADGTNLVLVNDMTPLVPAPGRFPLDVTRLRSANGEGWYDVGGLDLEPGWVDSPPTTPSGAVYGFCDTTSAPEPGETACSRGSSSGTLRYDGPLPHLPVVGYSWEGHARLNESYLAGRASTPNGYRPVTFQFGKTSGRCARTY